MAREGMADLIARLRDMIDDADKAVWDDDSLQNILDEYKVRVYREPLTPEKTLVSATDYEYKIYHSRYDNFEAGGTAYFQVEDSAGNQRGTADYSVDYINGVVTMAADQEGTVLYLTGWSYDLAAAAADCWRRRAAKVSSYYDVDADGHRLSRSQWHRHCLQMSEFFARQAKPRVARLWRVGDL